MFNFTRNFTRIDPLEYRGDGLRETPREAR
jgi:hypothetical protein